MPPDHRQQRDGRIPLGDSHARQPLTSSRSTNSESPSAYKILKPQAAGAKRNKDRDAESTNRHSQMAPQRNNGYSQSSTINDYDGGNTSPQSSPTRKSQSQKSKRSSEDSEDEAPSAKKPKQDADMEHTQWKPLGKAYPRIFDLFMDIQDTILAGLATMSNIDDNNGEPPKDEENVEVSEKLARQLATFDHLKTERAPLIRYLLKGMENGDANIVKEVSGVLKAGFMDARSQDVANIKGAVMGWIGAPDRDKNHRGFTCNTTARMLIPGHLEFTTELCERYATGEETPKWTWFPRFVWNPDKKPETLYPDGLLESDILIKAAILVLHGPSAVPSDGQTVKIAKSSKATKKPNAKICGIEKVNVRFVAYIVAMVYFAFSSCQSFNDEVVGFPLDELYYYVISFCNERSGFTNKLLRFWNRSVFGNSRSMADPTDEDSAGALFDAFFPADPPATSPPTVVPATSAPVPATSAPAVPATS